MKLKYIIIIPARLKSSRLKSKPLLNICGKPMIIQTSERARLSSAAYIYVATDDVRIANIARLNGFDTLITNTKNLNGTERLSESVKILKLSDEKIIVNLQVDEPFTNPLILDKLAYSLYLNKYFEVVTCASKITKTEDFFNPNIVKIVFNSLNHALYFSRSPIPWSKSLLIKNFKKNFYIKNNQINNIFKHIGIYSYKTNFLKKFTNLKYKRLEQIESLEQLRILENGHKIFIRLIDEDIKISIDTEKDLKNIISKVYNEL